MKRKANTYLLKCLYIVLIIIYFILSNIMNIYAYWYEEPIVYETEDVNNKWWLTRKQKQAEKQKQDLELNEKIEENKNRDFKDKNIRWLYSDFDTTKFPKNKWEVIDEDNDGIGYNYYFDKDGYLLIDTITPDYKIVDHKGREVDMNFRPIEYKVLSNNNKNELVETEVVKNVVNESSNVILANGVNLKNKDKLYDNSVDKNMNNYIEKSDRYIKETKVSITNGVRWKNCSSLKGKGGYIIFFNPNNNFNKVTAILTTQQSPYEDDTSFVLKVYDQDEYDKYEELHHFYDLYEIYEYEIVDKIEPTVINFTFDRSIKRLRFEIDTVDDYNSRTCYFNDLKYGFSKAAFAEELKRKRENEEEIEELKRLGIYVEDYTSFDALDDYGNIIYEDGEIDDDFEDYRNDFRDDYLLDIYEEETKSYEDRLRDSNTGPAFDENLQNIKQVGPAFIDIE